MKLHRCTMQFKLRMCVLQERSISMFWVFELFPMVGNYFMNHIMYRLEFCYENSQADVSQERSLLPPQSLNYSHWYLDR